MNQTIVNAAFQRRVGGKLESANLTKLAINLPPEQFGSSKFRDLVYEHKPDGEGWYLLAYVAPDEYKFDLLKVSAP